jgi:UDP:flavonoid glycosyltransferase YjiC (YdhE family)
LILKTVLFAWELGRGLGHLFTIRRMVARLKGHGIRTIAAVTDLSSGDILEGSCDEIVQAPAWPLARQDARQRAGQSSATLNDILSSAGLADLSAVRELLVAWDDIFSRFGPQLVVADFAPMAALTARGRIPLMQIGNGYTLPPDDMPRFPRLHGKLPPQWNEDDTLCAVNEAAQSLGFTRLERLPQLFSGNLRLVQTFPLLDPYDTQRVEILDGPLLDAEPIERSVGTKSILVYLSGGYEVPELLLATLAPFGEDLHMFAPGLTSAQRDALTRSGARVDTSPFPLRDALASARLAVHSGGSGVASEALAAGVPQVIVSAQIEQTLNGEALQRAGLGTLIEGYNRSERLPFDDIAAACADKSLAARALAAGRWHREYLLDKNPALKCEQACLRFLGE